MLKKNEILTVRFDGYTSDGLAVAHPDGEALFVPFALIGESAEVKVVRAEKTRAYGKLQNILTASNARVEPDCALFGRCGGCALRHMDYEEEKRMKRQRVRDAFSRIARIDPGELPIFGAQSTARYRNKSVFPVVQTPGGPAAGYYRARSHDVIPVTRCLLGAPAADCAREAVLQWMRENRVPGYSDGRPGQVRHIFVRTSRSGQTQVCVMVQGQTLRKKDALARYLQRAVPGLASVAVGYTDGRLNTIACGRYETIFGADAIEETLLGLKFRLSPASFFQVNPDQAETLYSLALDFADLKKTDTALDLYCGTGTITLLLASRAGSALGAEIVPAAIEDARENAARNGAENAEFFCADASAAARRLASDGLRPDVVCVDPPRKGLAPDVVDAIAAMAPRRVVYVSCDPATLARDCARLAERGYTFQKAACVDMFPRCAHVESVALLTREDA